MEIDPEDRARSGETMDTRNGSTPKTSHIHSPPRETFTANELERLESIVGNATTFSRRMMEAFFDPRRNYYEECGYPLNGPIEPRQLHNLYEREAIAARVVEVMPKESWQTSPEVYDSEEEEKTPFETAWDELNLSLRGEESWYKDAEGLPVWEYLLRADILSGIGTYGVILLGLSDMRGDDGLSKPVRKGKSLKLTSLRVFPEALATISAYETNRTSPRYGRPIQYQVTFNDPELDSAGGFGAPASVSVNVHYSRIVHLTDNNHTSSSSEVFSPPRMKPVLNPILGIQKIACASPEAFWKGCLNLLALETHPQLGGDVNVDLSSLRSMVENVQNGMQKWMSLMGMSAKSIAPTVTDPTTHLDKQIELICIKLGIPVRIFKGSERGELASTQDDGAWNDRVRQRRYGYITPRIIVPFVDRLISLGILPEPAEEGYHVYWSDLESHDKLTKSTIAKTQTETLAAAVSGNVMAVTGDELFLTEIMGFDQRLAEAMIEAGAEKEQEMADLTAERDLEAQRAGSELEMDQQGERIDRGLESDPAMDQFSKLTGGEDDEDEEDDIGDDERLLKIAKQVRNEGGELWDWQCDSPVTNATKKKLTGGKWVTLDNGVKVYLKSGRIEIGPKALKDKMNDDAKWASMEAWAESGKVAAGKGNPKKAKKAHDVAAEKAKAVYDHKTSDEHSEASEAAGGKFTPKPPKLNKEDAAAFKDYSEDYGYDINQDLRNGDKPTGRSAEVAERVSKVIQSQPEFPTPVETFRGLSWTHKEDREAFVKGLKPGGTLQMAGFQSTSIDRKFVEGAFEGRPGGSVMMVIKAKKGVKMEGDLTHHDNQQEILLDHNSSFKVLKVTTEGGRTVVEMEQL